MGRRPVVAIAHSEDDQASLRQALGLLSGGRSRLGGRPPKDPARRDDGFAGKTVVIVPNWVKAVPPETGAVVGAAVLGTLIQELGAHRPKRIVVAAGSGGDPTPKVFKDLGFDRVIRATGADFVDLNHGPFTEIDISRQADGDGHVPFPTRLKVNRLYEEMDALVSFTVIKVHEEAVASLSLKNVALSWPPAEIHGFPKKRQGLHEDLHAFISAMAWAFPISLAVLSGCPAMVGTGPVGGKAVWTGLMIAGTDPVAVDVVGARLLGFLPQAVGYLDRLMRAGRGEGDLRKVEFRGVPLPEAELIFSRAAYGAPIALDKEKLRPVHLPRH